MARAFVSVGSNIDPEKNVHASLRLLKEKVFIRAISKIYRTDPIGPPGQPFFYNCVVEIETRLSALDLKLTILRAIETELGRIRTADKYAARIIDLDLILYNDHVITTEDLTLPDPEIARRPFLAIPLQELAPGLVLPGSGQSIDDAAKALAGSDMQVLEQYTEQLRKEIPHEKH